MHDIFFLDFFCARIFFWYLPNPQISNDPSLISLLRRGLHEVSSEGKVSAQGVMGRAK